MDFMILSGIVFGILAVVGLLILPGKTAVGFIMVIITLFVILNLFNATPGVDAEASYFFSKNF